LRQHFAETLLAQGKAAEAEKEFREALGMAPNSGALKLGLARAFLAQEKNSHALALLEDIVKQPQAPARAFILHARLLLGLGEAQQAVYQYRRGIEADPSVADPALAQRLGIDAEEEEESEVVEGRVRATWEGEDEGGPNVDLERPQLKFKDVGGMEKLKEEIQLKIILPLTNPDLYKAYGKKTGGGILMYGPPGCGKTYLARATAGEINATFIAVGINEVLDMWIGASERNLHELFENARAHTPCVLFFDEVDALGANRADMRHSSGRHLINQFLAELDGVKDSNEGVLILAASSIAFSLSRRRTRERARRSFGCILKESRCRISISITSRKRRRGFPAPISRASWMCVWRISSARRLRRAHQNRSQRRICLPPPND
jgi:SpoVK/Ycf46/Vps4 family AAA+-type ATPase